MKLLTTTQQSRVRSIARENPDDALDLANTLLEGYGVEYIPGMRDSSTPRATGLSYINVGETYSPTVCYDHNIRRFHWNISLSDVLEWRIPAGRLRLDWSKG